MSVYDKEKARLSFDRAAHRYDQSAKLQQQVAKHLIDLVTEQSVSASAVLDIGCGTGQVTEAMCRLFPKGEVVALDFASNMLKQTKCRLQQQGLSAELICADAEKLPFSNASFDLIVSSLMLQWSNALGDTLSSYHESLCEGGQLFFSTFTQGTLHEVQQSWKNVDHAEHTSQFLSINELKAIVTSAGFSHFHVVSETIVMTYPSLREMIMEMKHIGASNAHKDRDKGLTGKRRFGAFEKEFEQYRLSSGQYPCTWELAYVICNK